MKTKNGLVKEDACDQRNGQESWSQWSYEIRPTALTTVAAGP